MASRRDNSTMEVWRRIERGSRFMMAAWKWKAGTSVRQLNCRKARSQSAAVKEQKDPYLLATWPVGHMRKRSMQKSEQSTHKSLHFLGGCHL